MTHSDTLKSILSQQMISLSPKQAISVALDTMKDNAVSSIVVVDAHKCPIGIFTEHDALKIITQNLDTSKSIETVMTKNPVCVKDTMLVHDAYMLMEEHTFRHLIVINEEEHFIGIASEGDFLRYLGFESLSNQKVVQDVMSEAPLIIDRATSLSRAVILMREYNCEYAIVLNDATPIGIITERDLVQHYADIIESKYETVENILSGQLTMIKQSTSLQEAALLMEHHGVHQLIILNEQNSLVGLLSRHDVLRAIHGAYFEFLINLVEKKSNTIKSMDSQAKKSIFLNNIINTIPDLIWLKNTEGIYLACNKTFEKFFGAKESEIVGKTDFDFVDDTLATFFQENDQATIEAGISHANEEQLVFADGSYSGQFHTVKTPMRDKNGTIIGILGIAHDISERKHKDDEIAQIQAQAHIGTWEWNIQEKTYSGSSEALRIFDIPEAQTNVTDAELIEHIHEDDKEIYLAEKKRMLKNRKVTEHIFRVVSKEGKIRWIRANGEFKYGSHGEVTKAIGVLQDISEHIEHKQQLEFLANFDTLTELPNRGSLLLHLQNSLETSKRYKKTIALIMFDLDRFKDVNDSFGHSAGDELLRLVAKRFSLRLREGDFLARLGGDEFAIVMENFTHPEDPGRLANEMIKLLVEEYKLSSSALVHIGASSGIALYPEHGQKAEILLQHADAALYNAKEEGRGIYRYYTDELTNSARLRVDYETRLRRAITHNEFEVYYQPQVHIATGRILGAEALIRWHEPELGMVCPTTFIPIAEETGFINEIGEWVLNETCRQGKIWLDKGYRLILAVNVSSHQIRHQDIPKMVATILKKHKYKAEHLEIEITESALMQREEEVVLMLHQLRAMGIRLAIDDFGTGYSSLSYLKRFPIDVLKIDKSFIDDLPFEKDDMAIVTAIIAMGQALGFQVLAEGTERIEQIEFLKEKGCTMYQGYYKSEPIPAAEFEKLVEENLS